MGFLPQDFEEYISYSCNRMEFICNWLEKNGVDSTVINLDGKKHILVQFNVQAYNPKFKIKTIISHYDRVDGSPGANDNSAANWCIMNLAVALKNYSGVHNIRIFFTDGEELGWNSSIKQQGAFSIASTFNRLGINKDDVYVFDACGRGTIPILARTSITSGASLEFKNRFADLFNRTQELLKAACGSNWMSLPIPYSDNASFLACSIPAVAITMLPAEEATLYARNILNNSTLENQILNRDSTRLERKASGNPSYGYKERMPLTWKLFHSEADSIDSLTPESFVIMSNILQTIAKNLTPNYN